MLLVGPRAGPWIPVVTMSQELNDKGMFFKVESAQCFYHASCATLHIVTREKINLKRTKQSLDLSRFATKHEAQWRNERQVASRLPTPHNNNNTQKQQRRWKRSAIIFDTDDRNNHNLYNFNKRSWIDRRAVAVPTGRSAEKRREAERSGKIGEKCHAATPTTALAGPEWPQLRNVLSIQPARADPLWAGSFTLFRSELTAQLPLAPLWVVVWERYQNGIK